MRRMICQVLNLKSLRHICSRRSMTAWCRLPRYGSACGSSFNLRGKKMNYKMTRLFSCLGVACMMFCICSCSDVLVDLRALNGSSASEEAQNSGSVLEPITFGGTTYQNTNEVVVIAKNKTATVNMTDDSSFSSYYTNGLRSDQGIIHCCYDRRLRCKFGTILFHRQKQHIA